MRGFLWPYLSHDRSPALGGKFPAIDRREMWRVAIEIGPADAKLRLVRIDPLPQLLARGESLQTGLPVDAHNVDGKPVAIAAAVAMVAVLQPMS